MLKNRGKGSQNTLKDTKFQQNTVVYDKEYFKQKIPISEIENTLGFFKQKIEHNKRQDQWTENREEKGGCKKQDAECE